MRSPGGSRFRKLFGLRRALIHGGPPPRAVNDGMFMNKGMESHSSQPAADETMQPLEGWKIRGDTAGALSDCCLVVPTYRRPDEIASLLRAVSMIYECPSEVVIVDGSPDRETEQAVRGIGTGGDLPFELRYVKSPPGLTRQRNAGIDASSKEIVFFLDDDCQPMPDYFREIRRVFIEDAEGRIGAVSGLAINEMLSELSWRWKLRLATGLVPRIDPGVYHPSGTSVPVNTIGPFKGLRRIDTLAGCSMTFRRAVLLKNRFSEFFRGYSQGEDLEMSLRVGGEWELYWCGDGHVVHNHAPGGRPASFRKGEMEVRNRHFIWKKYSPDAALIDRFRFWADMFFLIAMDLIWFARHPLAPRWLIHAGGVGYGMAGCIASPPRFSEPSARRQYLIRWEEVNDEAGLSR